MVKYPKKKNITINGIDYLQSHAPSGNFGGTFVASTIGEGPKTFNAFNSKDNISSTMSEIMYDGLLTTDAVTGHPIPKLAKSFSISDNGMDYIIKLRKGVKWSDGKPVYEKTFVSTTFRPNNAYYAVATGVEQYISQEGYVHRKDYPDIWSRIPSRPSATLSVAWGATSTNSGIQMEWGSGWGNDGGTIFDKIVLTVRYTKRSDYQ